MTDSAPQTFSNVLQVLAYLRDEGWRIAQSTLYLHKKEGKLKANVDGMFTKRAVDKYARTFLVRRDTGKSVAEEDDGLHREKLQEEIARLRVQRKKFEHDLAVAEGRYLPREDLALELAARASVIEAGFRHRNQSQAAEIIQVVSGDPARAPELIALLDRHLDEQLNEFATTREFLVMAVPGDVCQEADKTGGRDGAD